MRLRGCGAGSASQMPTIASEADHLKPEEQLPTTVCRHLRRGRHPASLLRRFRAAQAADEWGRGGEGAEPEGSGGR